MTSTTERWLDRGRLVVLAALPLLSVSWVAERRELPRITLAELAGGIGLALAARSGRLRLDRIWSRAALAFAGAAVLASAAATSPWRSWFGPYEGHAGALALLGYLALAAVPASPASRPLWARVLVGLGAWEGGWALLQWSRGQQPLGSVGHIVFLAGFCMLAGCMALSLALQDESSARSAVWSVALLLCWGGVLATSRRGPLLGLAVGSFTLLATVPRAAIRGRRIAALAIAALLIAAPILIFPTPGLSNVVSRFRDSAERKMPARWDTAQRRLQLYQVGLAAFGRHPLLGNGFGSFRDQDAQVAATEGEVETSVHDFPMEILVSMGGLGALAFLFLARRWLRLARTALATQPSPELLGAGAVVAAELVFLLFNFDQPAMAAWAWSLAGWLLPPSEEPTRATGLVPAALLATLTFVVPVLSDGLAATGLRAESAGDRARAAADLESATRIAPYECFYPLRLAALLRQSEPVASASRRIEALEPCAQLEPNSAFLHYHLGLALADRAGAEATMDRARATVELARATALAPSVPQFHHALAQVLVADRDLNRALGEIETAADLETDPQQRAGDWNDRGNILVMLGRATDAAESYRWAGELDPRQSRSRENLEHLQLHSGSTAPP